MQSLPTYSKPLRRKIGVLTLVLALVFVTAYGCRTSKKQAAPAWNMRDLITNNTSADDAIVIMEEHGYKCDLVTGGKFKASYWDGEQHSGHREFQDIDFVHCRRSSKDAIVAMYYHVALVLDENQRVVEVLKHSEGVGP